MTITEFLIAALAQSAGEVFQHQGSRILSNHDRDLFLALLENPPEPNAILRKAAKNINGEALDPRTSFIDQH